MVKKTSYAVIGLFIALILSGIGNVSFAQTGDIRGHIEDAESGEPLPGVNVVVTGTEKGAATDENGDFVIINVDPGTYDVQASMIGYANVTKTDVLVTIDQIARVNFALESSAIRGEEVVVQATRGVIHTEVSNSQLVSTSDQIMETAGVRTMSEYLANQPGVSDPQNLSIRGGDSHETGMIVDGLTMMDERAGRPQAAIPLSAIDQVSVLSGGYNAEHGEFRSGIINVKTKTGGTQRYSGRLDVSGNTPHMKRFGRSIYDPYNTLLRPYADPAVAFQGTEQAWSNQDYIRQQYPSFAGWNQLAENYNRDRPADEQMTPLNLYLWNAWMHMVKPPFDKLAEMGYDIPQDLQQAMTDHAHPPEGGHSDYNLDLGIGGPLPFIGQKLGDATFYLSHNLNRGYYTEPVTINSQLMHSTLLTLQSNLTSDLKLLLNGYYFYHHGASGDRMGEGLQRVDNVNTFADLGQTYYWYQTYYHTKYERSYMGGITLNDVINSKSFWELRFNTVYSQGRTPNNADEFPRDTALKARFGPNVAVNEMPYNYSAGYTEVGGYKYGMYDQPYGLSHRFANKAGEKEQRSDTWQYRLKFNFTNQLNVHHQLKTGLNLDYTTFDHRMFWVRPFKNETARNYSWGNNKPLNTGLYLQDRVTYQGVVANIGLRADYYNPGGVWPVGDYYNFDIYGTVAPPTDNVIDNARMADIWDVWQAFDQEHPGFLQPVKAHFAVSPRVGLAFPVTTNSKFYFNYGHFRQLPPAQELYHVDRRPYRVGFISEGNPNLEPPRTISYETGVEYDLLGQYLIRIAGYYKDITGDPGELDFTSSDGRVDWSTYRNNQYQDIQGIEFSITKNIGRYLSGWANYNYMIVKDGYTGVSTAYQDPSKTELFGRYEAQESRPLPRPRFRANITFRTPSSFGMPTLNKLLENWRLSILPQWHAGGYFTWNPLGKLHISDNLQWPDYFQVDARLTRSFMLGNNTRIEFYADIANLFNQKINNFSSGNPFYGGSDRREYLASLHLPMYDSQEFDVLREQNPGKYIAGNDKVGDVRSADKPYINDPNLLDLWGYIQPRDIWFGVRVQF